MAKTKKLKKPKELAPRPGPQAPPGVWTPKDLYAVLTSGTIDEKVALLQTAGILDERGELAKKYRSWGQKASRTPERDDNG
jgi:hypothetical protein